MIEWDEAFIAIGVRSKTIIKTKHATRTSLSVLVQHAIHGHLGYFDSLLLEGSDDGGSRLKSGHKRGDGGDDFANDLDHVAEEVSNLELFFGGFFGKIHC